MPTIYNEPEHLKSICVGRRRLERAQGMVEFALSLPLLLVLILGTLVGIADGDIWIKYDRGIDQDYLAESCPPAAQVGLGNRIEVTVNSSFQPFTGIVNLPSFPLQSTSRRTIVVDVQIE